MHLLHCLSARAPSAVVQLVQWVKQYLSIFIEKFSNPSSFVKIQEKFTFWQWRTVKSDNFYLSKSLQTHWLKYLTGPQNVTKSSNGVNLTNLLTDAINRWRIFSIIQQFFVMSLSNICVWVLYLSSAPLFVIQSIWTKCLVIDFAKFGLKNMFSMPFFLRFCPFILEELDIFYCQSVDFL